MFDSIYSTNVEVWQYFLVLGISLVAGIVFSWLFSLKLRSSKGYFIVLCLIPAVIATITTFASRNIGIGAGIAIGGAFFAIRFRSAPGTAEELIALLIGMACGIALGQGYISYGVLIMVGLSLIYFLLTYLPIFEHKNFKEEKLLKITIPESLDYSDVFDETFTHYLKEYELVGVKTTGMGSMFKLSYRIKMKDIKEEKELIDEIRTKNGNLEISVLPYVRNNSEL